MVLAVFGLPMKEDELRELCDCTIFGTSAVELIQAARSLGFTGSRKYSLTIADLSEFTNQGYFPIVYLVTQPETSQPDVHAVIVLSVLSNEVIVMDPKFGIQPLPLTDFSRMWSQMRNITVVIAR